MLCDALRTFSKLPLRERTWENRRAMELELEDDGLFADISRQISLLIMDEDEHEHEHDPLSLCPSVSPLQGLLGGSYQTAVCEQSGRRRESKGTGVFIPRSSHPRRKHHHHHHHLHHHYSQGRLSSFNSNPQSHHQRQYQKQHDNTPTLTYSSSSSSSTVHASNPRRTYRDAASICLHLTSCSSQDSDRKMM